MSLSDLLNISNSARRDKARAQDLLPTPTSSSSLSTRLCNICYLKPASYSCPRCNVPFCSLACFRKKEHQECSAAFSSSAIRLAGSADPGGADGDRQGVADILARLESDEREARLRQEDGDEDTDDEDAADDNVAVRASITEDEVEAASTEQLLAMLSTKERETFLEAVKNVDSARMLMERVDRKAARRAQGQSSQKERSVLIRTQSLAEEAPPKSTSKLVWQTSPWFERPEACPYLTDRSSEHVAAYVASIGTIMAAGSTTVTSSPVNLTYNLCTVLMAYAYVLRHFDLESLSQLLSHKPQTEEVMTRRVDDLGKLSDEPDNDDEPPPLEPDDAPLPPPLAPSASRCLDDALMSDDALSRLDTLVPFLFSQPTSITDRTRDPSKLVLESLDDASMWLLSRLSLDSEVGQSGVDALNIRLLEDLSLLLTGEQVVPTFDQESEVEPRYRLASKFASLPPDQAFTAAQTPLLLNAVADLFFFLEDQATLPASSHARVHFKAKQLRLAQRKLCFYLCSAILKSSNKLPLSHEVQTHTERLRQRINAEREADRLSAAMSRLDRGNLQEGMSPIRTTSTQD